MVLRKYIIEYDDSRTDVIGYIGITGTSIKHAKVRFNNSYGSYRKIKRIKWANDN